MTRFLYNHKALRERRKQLRANLTDTEKILWSCIRSRKLGVRFCRQYSTGGYVLDFYCPEKRICIELDGSQHLERKEYDQERTLFLNANDITVIRFWNNEIIKNLNGVLMQLREIINTPQSARADSSPT